MTSIYGLYDGADALRYIGRTVKPLSERLSSHWYEARSGGQSSRIYWLRGLTHRPAIRLLDVCPDNEGNACERYWIILARDYGCVLVNEKNGGARRPSRIVEASWAGHLQAAKKRCHDRLATMRAQSAAEQKAREDAAWGVRQMRHSRCHTPYSSLNHEIFQSAFRSGLENYFAAHPDAKECFITTDQVLMLAYQPQIAVDDQREIFRRMSIDKVFGCAIVAWDFWRFPRIEPSSSAPEPIYSTTPLTTTRTSIFDK